MLTRQQNKNAYLLQREREFWHSVIPNIIDSIYPPPPPLERWVGYRVCSCIKYFDFPVDHQRNQASPG